MKKLGIIVGCRPNYVKAAALVKEFARRPNLPFTWYIGNTGQHYQDEMSHDFAKYFNIERYIKNSYPFHLYGLGSDETDVVVQCANLIYRSGKIIEANTAAVMVLGDVDSSAAAALAARRMRIPVYHYEAGLRCGDMDMLEEQNRVIIDTLSDEFFITEQSAYYNLLNKSAQNIHFVGDIMVDILMQELTKECPKADGEYGVLTLHRAENVDNPDIFWSLLETIGKLGLGFVYPVHPRVLNFHGSPKKLHIIENIRYHEPMRYGEFIRLCRNAKVIITDSGGVQTEAMIMGVPCITLRDKTEKLCTIEAGTNYLAGTNPEIIKIAYNFMHKNFSKHNLPRGHDGKAAKRTVDVLEKLLA